MNDLNCMMMMVRKNWRKILKLIHKVIVQIKGTVINLNNLRSYMGNLMMSLTCYSLKMSLNYSCCLNFDYLSNWRRNYEN